MTSPQAVAAPRFPETRQFLDQIRTRVGKVVVGQDVVVERVLIALLTSGHLLLQGVPGLAKTLLVAAVSKTVDLAFARIQGSGYRAYGSRGVDRGSISLVGAGDLERDTDPAAIAAWPALRGFSRLTPILIPASDDPMGALREGAATLRADIVALYTVDTDFRVDDRDIGPLGLLTLGLAPTKNAVVNSTVSIAFFDVRTGFCYGTAEGSASDDQLASAWTSEQAMDDARRRAERAAFERMLVEAGKAWAGIAAQATAGNPAQVQGN